MVNLFLSCVKRRNVLRQFPKVWSSWLELIAIISWSRHSAYYKTTVPIRKWQEEYLHMEMEMLP
ncbi:hypothetical protein ACM14_05135 [Delftia sp. JD2]|nr:hypothetical protein ACM14_05135 [Delftia sp. JD2]